MPRWAAKVDGNQAQIVEALRAYGWSVYDLSRVGGGFPDLIIAKAGRTILVEVKTLKGRLRAVQEAFLRCWPAEIVVMRSLEDVQALNRSGQGTSPVGTGAVPQKPGG